MFGRHGHSCLCAVPQEERARKYAAEVQSLQFNVLVTTYEYIMRDRSRLAKVGHSGHQPRSRV